MPADSVVRMAVARDVAGMLELARIAHGESGVAPLEEEKVSSLLRAALTRDGAMAGVIGPVGAPEAMIALQIGVFWYSTKPHLEELFACVRPDCRRSGHGKALVEYAKLCAARANVPLLIGVISSERMGAKVKMYSRLLGTPAGAFFVFNNPDFVPAGEPTFWRQVYKTGRGGRGRHKAAAAGGTLGAV